MATSPPSLPPSRGLAIVEAEVVVLTMAMKRGHLWTRSPESLHPTLLKPFLELKQSLVAAADLDSIDPDVFLAPFLDVVRSETVTGPVTGLALAALNKFLAYNLLHEGQPNVANAVENLADAVTHARFVGVDPSSDEIVLMKIMEVLRSLMLSSVGLLLTNESVCEIMQSMFRICFENRLSELLRKTAEHSLNDMIQLLFTRLPSFSEENLPLLKKLKMRNSHDGGRSRRRQQQGGAGGGGAGSKQRNKPAASPARPQQAATPKPPSTPDSKDGSGSKAAAPQSPSSEAAGGEAVSSSGGGGASLSATVTSASLDESGNAGSSTPKPKEQFNVDSDVLARSPIGSVSDLTAAQSDTESQGGGGQPDSLPFSRTKKDDEESGVEKTQEVAKEEHSVEQTSTTEAKKEEVDITVTSPKGTERNLDGEQVASKETEEKQGVENGTVTSAGDDVAPNKESSSLSAGSEEFVNSQGVTFTPTADMVDDSGSLIPYGLPCVRELFRFLVSLVNPHDSHNQDSMIQIALSLLSTALETGADSLDRFESLLALVKDDLARNLVSLLSAERIGTFSLTLWLSYVVVESQRRHLKYQLEIFLGKLIDVVCSESQKVTYEHKELALDTIVRMYRMPGFLTQLYLNFDCDMYTSNTFEDLTKMLSKNAFPVTGLYSTNFLSLDALLTVVEVIETQCQRRIVNGAKDDGAKSVGTAAAATLEKSAVSKAVSPKCSGHQFGLAVNNKKGDDGVADSSSSTAAARPAEMAIPTHEEVMALKHRKKLITTATEQFNAKPAKGIAYMQECGLLKTPSEPAEIARFMRQNPHLDKKQMGDYISNRKNLVNLEAFCQSFDFCGVRIDEALRQFLEAFRLPGEAPLITLILEHFADHWYRSNEGTAIATPDSAFTLSYGIIMLNVDQHNKNHTKTNDPMTEEQFKRNLRGTNDGGDHDQDMLREIFHAIKTEEIVMPAEQTGLVRENYLWKCVLKRGHEDGADFLMAGNGYFDHDIFSIIWGPTVAALSYVFDKSGDPDVVRRALNGFQRCAMIAAHYRMSDVFDNLVISLCKFTTLLTVSESPYYFLPVFGSNEKAMAATRMVFALVQKHGDILRDGWKNVTECLLQLFKCKLLPANMMEAEDYVEATGRVDLFREEKQAAKAEPGLLNSFVSFISMSTEAQQKVRTPEEDEAAKLAAKCVRDCSLDSLVTESKFLLAESLQELVKFLVSGSQLDSGAADSSAAEGGGGGADGGVGGGPGSAEHATLFYLELLVRITAQNRDRVGIIWRPVSDHLSRLIMSSTTNSETFMLERSVTALVRLAVRLSRKEDLASTVVQSLRILPAIKVNALFVVCRHIAFGLHELLRNNAANIHEADDWAIIFTLIEIVGAGANPNVTTTAAAKGKAGEGGGGQQQVSPAGRGGGGGRRRPLNRDEDSGHGASSESEAANSRSASPAKRERSESISSGGWIVLGNSPAKQHQQQQQQQQQQQEQSGESSVTAEGLINFNRLGLVHQRPLVMHDSLSFLKCCESLAFLVRDVAHITPHNFYDCVMTIRTFVEASFQGRSSASAAAAASEDESGDGSRPQAAKKSGHGARSHAKRTPMGRAPPMRRVQSAPNNMDYDADESDSGEDFSSEYMHVSLQLLDLMHTLHTRAGQIHKSWAEENHDSAAAAAATTGGNLWTVAWCPLLQGMARMCCDKRSHIRTSALTSLQRALLYHDLQTLSPREWEAAFTSVLFPMLDQLLIKSAPGEKTAMEETRTRAATLLGKVFLQHLSPLTTLPSFTALWLTVLDFMRRFIGAASSDLLADAVPESLKNMLLVMDTASIFFTADGGQATPLWALTCDKLDSFLPKLMAELFGRRETQSKQQQPPSEAGSEKTADSSSLEGSASGQIPPVAAVSTTAAAAPPPPLPLPQALAPPSAADSGPPPPSPLEPPVLPASAFSSSSGSASAASAINQTSETATAASAASAASATAAASAPPPSTMPPPPPTFSMGPPSILPTSAMRAATSVGAATASPGPINIPSLPQIAPMPPPPISLPSASQQGFQPIHAAPPAATASLASPSVPVATPRPLPATNPHLASYFAPGQQQQQQQRNAGHTGVEPPSAVAPPVPGNILTAAFTPTMPNTGAATVFLSSAETAEEKK